MSAIYCYPKIDLGLANIPGVVEQIGNAFGFGEDEILKVLDWYVLVVYLLYPLIQPGTKT